MIKKISLLLMATFFVFVMSACVGNQSTSLKEYSKKGEETTTSSAQQKTKTVTHLKGTTEIPVHPKRLVDISGSAEELDILGVPYIASANTSMYDGITVPDHLKNGFQQKGIEIVGNWCCMI